MSAPTQLGPLVFGHRGASVEAPENTLEAFSRALLVGADGVELDIHATADDVLVVDHDGVIDGVPMMQMTRDEISEAKPYIPDLSAVLSTIGSMICNIEIKNWPFPESPIHDPTQRAASLLADMMHAHDTSTIIVSSFDVGAIGVFRELSPHVDTGWLTSGVAFSEALSMAVALGHPWMHCHDHQLGSDPGIAIAAAHDAELRVNVWTVDDPTRWGELTDGHADALITNDPRRFREWQAQRS